MVETTAAQEMVMVISEAKAIRTMIETPTIEVLTEVDKNRMVDREGNPTGKIGDPVLIIKTQVEQNIGLRIVTMENIEMVVS